jgi:ankyrin repeat protein
MSSDLDNAVASGDLAKVRELLAAGASPEGTAEMPPLVLASRDGQYEIVDALLNAGAAVDRPWLYGKTALILAAGFGANLYPEERAKASARFEPIVARLLAAGADPNGSNHAPLYEALRDGTPGTIKLLLDAGAKLADPYTLRSFVSSPMVGRATVLGALIERHPDGCTLDELLLAAAINACQGVEEVASVLLDRGASVEAEDDYGGRPMLFAVYLKNAPLVRVLRERGASIDVPVKKVHRIDDKKVAKGTTARMRLQQLWEDAQDGDPRWAEIAPAAGLDPSVPPPAPAAASAKKAKKAPATA